MYVEAETQEGQRQRDPRRHPEGNGEAARGQVRTQGGASPGLEDKAVAFPMVLTNLGNLSDREEVEKILH
jgi:hypothetical protein